MGWSSAEKYDSYSNASAGGLTRYLYTAREFDPAANLYYRAWCYDPDIGRFISEDPIHDSLDLYKYAQDIPSTFSDATGLSARVRGKDIRRKFKQNRCESGL